MKAFVGISINHPYFTKKNIEAYIDFLNGINDYSIKELAFLIGDLPYALTYSAIKKTSLTQSFEIVKNKGIDYRNAIFDIINSKKLLSFDVKIINWSDITGNTYYQSTYSIAYKFYKNNTNFAKDVREQVWHNLKDRLENKEINDFEFELLDMYVLEEVAGLLTMSEHLGYTCEIYPGEDLCILKKITSGNYKFYDSYKRDFLSIKFK